jgi:peroxiredoxin
MNLHYILMSIAAVTAISAGVAAPGFEAVSYDGREISLSALREQGPVVLVFLRGFS